MWALSRLGVMGAAVIFIFLTETPGWGAGLGKILGSIKNEKGIPLAGADISILPVKSPTQAIKAQTDRLGRFRIDKLAPGQYAITIIQTGFKPIHRPPIKVTGGRNTSLHLILQLAEFIAMDPHPSNWDIRTVLKAGQDRRLIFRDHSGAPAPASRETEPVSYSTLFRNSAFRISTALDDPYNDRRVANPNLSFAHLPLSFADTKFIVAGHWNPIDKTNWKIRNTIDHRLTDQHNLRLSLGYGKTGLFAARSSMTPVVPVYRDHRDDYSLVKTFSMAAENQSRFSDFLTIAYGFGFEQIRSFDTRTYIHPELQLTLTPSATWLVRGMMTSRREQEASHLMLPEGDWIPLNDPVTVVQGGRQVHWNVNRHYELGVVRRLPDQSDVSLSTYADRSNGRTPLLATVLQSNGEFRPRLFQLNEAQTDSEGLRLGYSRNIFDGLSGSIAYILATGLEAPRDAHLIPLSRENLLDLNRRGSFHLVSAQFDADLNKTGTKITTIIKWMPRKSINTLDFFSDYWEVNNSGLNLFIRQDLPLPLFMNLLSGWEASVDVRNLIDQTQGIFVTSSGETLLLKNIRSFRGGILFRF